MTVKELIDKLLDCNMNAEVSLCDNVEFEDEHCGTCVGSLYNITEVEGRNRVVSLHFDNRHHFARRKGDE